jgi:hypothetical protein
MVLESTGLVKALPQVTASRPTPVVSGAPSTARQLFTSTVAPLVDYASNVWMHAFKDKAIGPINRVQRVGAPAIIGTFLTVTTSVAEAEAHIASAQSWF